MVIYKISLFTRFDMCLLIKGIIFIAVFPLMMLGIGELLFSKADFSRFLKLIAGTGVALALFWVTYIAAIVSNIGFYILAEVYIALAALLSAGGWIGFIRKKQHCLKKYTPGKTELIYLAAAGAIILFQLLRCVLGATYFNTDDMTYIAQMTTAIDRGSMAAFEATTGDPAPVLRNATSTLFPWPIFWSVFSWVLRVHPAILMRTLLPILLVPVFYGVIYEAFVLLFPDSAEKRAMALCAAAVVCLLTAQVQHIRNWWPINVPWYGKSFGPSVMCPAVILFLARYEAASNAADKRAAMLAAFFAGFGGSMVSASAAILIPVAVFCWSVPYVLRSKDIKCIPLLAVCAMPGATASLALYLI